MKFLILLALSLNFIYSAAAQQSAYEFKQNIAYYDNDVNKSNEYINERCVLDIYYPKLVKNYATIVWFHGGGLTQGSKEIPEALKEKGACVVGVNYRLYPKAKSPDYIEDAAAAIAWVFNNITRLGGDSSLIFLSGHSAGGYLALITAMDKKYLAVYGIDANRIAGIIPFSAQTITHFMIREEHGIDRKQPVIDSMAPIYHVRADAPPLLLITGDRELELLGRYEENAYMMRMMKVAGHTQTRLLEMDGYDHNMTEPAFPMLIKEIIRIVEHRDTLKMR